MVVVELQKERMRALQRTHQAILDLEKVLVGMSQDASGRYLVEGILRTLRKTEARLAAGIRK